MADSFEIVSQRLTQELVGGHDLADVWEIGARSRPSGIYFVFRVDEDEHDADRVAARAAAIAGELEQIQAHENVSTIGYVQSIGSQGQLVDEVDVHYHAGGGRHAGTLRCPLRGLSADTLRGHVDAAVAHLGSIADL